ncbi:MAG: D-sedoheptulose 7-phosphate isomerase [bacterium]
MKLKEIFKEAIDARDVLLDERLNRDIENAIEVIVSSLKTGNKVLVAGNGGSASDAQHLTGELVGRFLKERRALPAIALSTNTSILTAIGNDYSFEKIFSRQVEAIGIKGDVFIAISTSGNAKNLIEAVEVAKKLSIKTIGLLGNDGGKLGKLVDIPIIVPLSKTPRVQEIHEVIIHSICEIIEEEMSKE